jgi:predicted hydrocarbon binding protein
MKIKLYIIDLQKEGRILSKNTATELSQEVEAETIPAFGYELMREVLLPEILGDDAPDILYWAGKQLARKYPLNNLEEIIHFFKQAGWGNLMILSETKTECKLELSSTIISKRLQSKEEHHFQMEAGFLAKQMEILKQAVSETFEHPRKRSDTVLFTVKWDRKDTLL